MKFMVVLFFSDIIAARYTGNEDDKYQAIRNMTELLSRTFSSHFVFPVLGHLDPAPSASLTNLWMHWLPLEALQTFQNGMFWTGIITISNKYGRLTRNKFLMKSVTTLKSHDVYSKYASLQRIQIDVW
jgi:hypothetical protein